MEPLNPELEKRLQKLGVGSYSRHILLCTSESCSGESQDPHPSWDLLKKQLAERGLSPGAVYRTKCHCLRVCRQGPIGVVYPEGVWYRNLTPENLQKVILQHLIDGKPVDELVIGHNPL